MADETTTLTPVPGSDSQMIVALRIVNVMGVVAVALIVAGVVSAITNHAENAIWLGIGAIGGSLGTALNAPTGVSNAIKAMSAPPTDPTQ